MHRFRRMVWKSHLGRKDKGAVTSVLEASNPECAVHPAILSLFLGLGVSSLRLGVSAARFTPRSYSHQTTIAFSMGGRTQVILLFFHSPLSSEIFPRKGSEKTRALDLAAKEILTSLSGI
jgi:hypothetical protein